MKVLHFFSVTLLLPLMAVAQWDTLLSPSTNKAYLKLSTDDLLQIDYSKDFSSGQTISQTSLISSPSLGNYSLSLANGQLYAFFQDDGDSSIIISELNDDGDWQEVKYSTTLSTNTTQFFDESTIMTSYDQDTGKQVIYIYGGRQSDTITNRLLQFDPSQKTLQSIMTSVAPTSFYGASNSILDSDSKTNILIGGKASSGWVSMFQIALFEYGSWTFKTVSQSTFGVNSRINALVMPVFATDDSEDVESVVVIGGTLGSNLASPYVLTLNMTDNWEWQNRSNVGDFDVTDCLGGVIIEETFISIKKSTSNKRDGSGYEMELYNVNNFESVDSFALKFTGLSSSVSSSDVESSSSLSSVSSSQQESSSLSSSAVSSSSSSSSSSFSSSSHSSSAHSSSLVASSTSQIAVSTSSVAATTSAVSHSSDNKAIVIIASIVPVVCVAIIGVICWFLWKKYSRSSSFDNDTDSDNNTEYSDEYLKAISSYDQASISSWNAKRDEFKRNMTQLTPNKTKKSMEFTFEGTTPVHHPQQQQHQRLPSHGMLQTGTTLQKLTKVYKPTPSRRSTGPFANPEDYEDRQELSPTSQSNKSRSSFFSTAGSHDDEEQKIDEFLSDRDVQVLVSSKRRSKLRITNPDVESMASVAEDREVESIQQLELESTDTGSTLSMEDPDVGKLDLDFGQDEQGYFRDVLRAFDSDDVTPGGSNVSLGL